MRLLNRLREILRRNRANSAYQAARMQMDFMRYWSDEMARPRNAARGRLLPHGFKLYSQNDEDGIIQEIFRRIGTTDRTFVEFGVESGVECNTVKLLIEGWSGLWIDSSRASIDAITRGFGEFLRRGTLTLVESKVSAENVDGLLRAANVTGEIDLLSIDIDFNDYWVWKSVVSINPRVVVIEYNASLRPPLSWVVPYDPNGAWRGNNYFGASLEALVRLGRSKGYRIVGCCFAGVNAFFVREDLCAGHFLEPASAEEHYEPPRYFAGLVQPGHNPQPGVYQRV